MEDNTKNPDAVTSRIAKNKALLLEHLRKIPIVQIACEKAGIGRTSFYRWRGEDAEFAKAVGEALAEGEELITDMTESQLISLIRDKNYHAIQLWLRHHHPKYAQRVEVTANINQVTEQLTSEQEALVREALRLVALPVPQESGSDEHGSHPTS